MITPDMRHSARVELQENYKRLGKVQVHHIHLIQIQIQIQMQINQIKNIQLNKHLKHIKLHKL